MTAETILEDDRWGAAKLEALAVQAVEATLVHVGLKPDDWLIGLLGCSDDRIAALNTDFRGKAAATNVLSWPSEERGPAKAGQIPDLPVAIDGPDDAELGDIAIAYETCLREAISLEKPFSAHVTHLLVHGTLHLLGYDHISDEDAAVMEKLEAEILATLGLEDPYGNDQGPRAVL
jgi:probable rRNA maturation factor